MTDKHIIVLNEYEEVLDSYNITDQWSKNTPEINEVININHFRKLQKENKEIKDNLKVSENNFCRMEDIAGQWMNDYDRLKEKYEPEVFVESIVNK